MKKFLTITIIAILAILAISTNVKAANVSTEEELIAAVEGSDVEIILNDNVALTKALEIGRNVTINLNGYNITAKDGMTDDSLIIVLHGGTLTINGNGSVSATNSNADARVAVKMTKNGNSAEYINSNPAKLILNSGTLEGTSFGIAGNGNADRVNTIITINGGTVKANGTAIYHPQTGTLTINAGTIEGTTGIEIRSGSLEVNGGNITGTGTPTTVTANGNGTTTVGAGIAIAQHTTQKDIDVVINGGVIKGFSALYESNPQSNNTINQVSIEINDGEFEAINGGTVAVYSEDKTGFINGGTFSSDVEAYIANDLETAEDEEGNMLVGELHTITVSKDIKNGKVSVSKDKAIKGEKIKLTVTPDKGYKLKSINLDFGRLGTEIEGTEFIMENFDTVVIAVFEKEETELQDKDEVEDEKEETVVEDKKDETPKTGSLNIALYVLTAIGTVALIGTVKSKNSKH